VNTTLSAHRINDLAKQYRLLHKASNDIWAGHLLLISYSPSLRRLIMARRLPSIPLPSLVHPRSTKLLAGKDAVAVINRLADGLDAQRILLDFVGRFEAFLDQVSAWTYADAAYAELTRCAQGATGAISVTDAGSPMRTPSYQATLEEDARTEVRDSVRSFDHWFASDLAVPGVAKHFSDSRHQRRLVRLKEVNARRNAIAHNRAKVDTEYLRHAGPTTLTPGSALVTNAQYLAEALLVLRLVAACFAECAIAFYGNAASGDIQRAVRLVHKS